MLGRRGGDDTRVFSLAARSALRRRRTSEELLPGAYLTDGVRLFRIVLQLHRADQRPLAALEDYLTFEVSLYSPDDLHEMRLRPVRAGARRALSGSEEVPAASVGSAQSNAGEVRIAPPRRRHGRPEPCR